jgi:O-antigen ligase
VGVPDSVILLAGLPLLAAVVLWALTSLPSFLLVAVLGAMIFPETVISPGGTQVALADLLFVVALGAWLITNALRATPDPWLAGNRMLLAMLLFVGVNAASVAWSVDRRDTLVFVVQLVQLVLLVPLAFASLPDSIRTVRTGMLSLIALTSGMAIATIVEFAPAAAAGDFSGTYLPGLHKNAIGSFLAAGFVLAYVLALSEPNPRVRRLLYAATIIELAGLFASGSRGGVLGGLVAAALASLILRRRRTVTVALVIAAGLSFAFSVGARPVEKRVSGAYDSSLVRKYSFDNAVDKIRDRPLLGLGGGAYFDYIPQLRIGVPDPNNMFLLTWAEIGVLGMAALLFLLARYLGLARLLTRLPAPYDTLGIAAAAAAMSQLVHFQVDTTWTRGTSTLTFAMIGLMLAVERLAAARPAVSVAAPETEPAASAAWRSRELAGTA